MTESLYDQVFVDQDIIPINPTRGSSHHTIKAGREISRDETCFINNPACWLKTSSMISLSLRSHLLEVSLRKRSLDKDLTDDDSAGGTNTSHDKAARRALRSYRMPFSYNVPYGRAPWGSTAVPYSRSSWPGLKIRLYGIGRRAIAAPQERLSIPSLH